MDGMEPKKLKVAYLGPIASYSHQAALACFSTEEYLLEPQSQIKDAFASVQANNSDFAVVPFENSTYGTVVFTLDLLLDRELKCPDLLVCGEFYLPVHHCLVGHAPKRCSTTLSDDHAWDDSNQMQANSNPKRSSHTMKNLQHISTIYSHPAAFGQCEKFLSLYLKGVEKQEVSSTSRAAQLVAEEGINSRSAAISSSLAADIHGLKLLAQSIQDRDDNSTRFFILKNGKSNPEGLTPSSSSSSPLHQPSSYPDNKDADKWKTLISFTLPQQPSGTLAGALQVFKNHGLNLTSINSRPSLEHTWHYVFLIEIQGRREVESDRDDDEGGDMNQALRELDTKTTGGWKWLGSWRESSTGNNLT